MLRHRFALAMVVLSLSLISGCDRAPTYESVIEDNVSALEELATILPTIKDEASANSAKPKLKELAEKFKTAKAEADKLPKPSKEDQEAITKKFEERMTKAMGTIMGESIRIGMNPQLKDSLDEVMGTFK